MFVSFYIYKRGEKYVFLNRLDETIGVYNTYQEAEKFAKENYHLIDFKISLTPCYGWRK